MGIVEDGPTLKTSNLAGPFAGPGQDIVDHPLVSAERVRGGTAELLTGFLNHLGFHRHLRFLEGQLLVSRH